MVETNRTARMKVQFTLQSPRCNVRLVLIVFALWSCSALFCGAGDYYRDFSRLVSTNELHGITSPLLVDTNNTANKITNVVINVENLERTGEISGIRLGMTMDEVVARWGKPQGGWSRCIHGLVTLRYEDAILAFEGNSLETISVADHPFWFEKGLSTMSKANEFIHAYGEPTGQHQNKYARSLVSTSTNASLRLEIYEGDLLHLWIERSPQRAEPWKHK